MTKTKNLIMLILLAMITITSCTKDELATNSGDEVIEEIDILERPMSDAQINYMSSLPFYDKIEFKRVIEGGQRQQSQGTARVESVWGTGTDQRVYKWTGSYWSEPNPAAGLSFVEVGSTDGNAVWGIGADQRVYKWTGSYWSEPNPAAGLYHITVVNEDMAIGMGDQGSLYITINGGVNWAKFTNIKNVHALSAGDFYNFLWVTDLGHQLRYFNSSTQLWEAVTTPGAIVTVRDVEAMVGGGVWLTTGNEHVFKSNNGVNFFEPNPALRLRRITGRSTGSAWGIGGAPVGGGTRVFKTSNSGASWYEPNTAAGLGHISAN